MKYKRDEINDLLVDYLENDLSEGLKKDLDLVIKNSPGREKTLKALSETRKIIQNYEPAMPELGEAYFGKLHKNIMADVANTKPHSPLRNWVAEQSWRSYASAAVVIFVSGTIFFSLLRPSLKFESAGLEQSGDMLLSISLEVPEAFADSLLNDRDSSEFLMDAMAEKVANLEEKHAASVMNELGEK